MIATTVVSPPTESLLVSLGAKSYTIVKELYHIIIQGLGGCTRTPMAMVMAIEPLEDSHLRNQLPMIATVVVSMPKTKKS